MRQTKGSDNVTYRELVSEIRTLRGETQRGFDKLEDCLDSKVNRAYFIQVKNDVESLLQLKDRMWGYVIGASTLTGGIVAGAKELLMSLF